MCGTTSVGEEDEVALDGSRHGAGKDPFTLAQTLALVGAGRAQRLDATGSASGSAPTRHARWWKEEGNSVIVSAVASTACGRASSRISTFLCSGS